MNHKLHLSRPSRPIATAPACSIPIRWIYYTHQAPWVWKTFLLLSSRAVRPYPVVEHRRTRQAPWPISQNGETFWVQITSRCAISGNLIFPSFDLLDSLAGDRDHRRLRQLRQKLLLPCALRALVGFWATSSLPVDPLCSMLFFPAADRVHLSLPVSRIRG